MTYLGIALSFDDVGRILENVLTAANYVLLPGFIGREEQSTHGRCHVFCHLAAVQTLP